MFSFFKSSLIGKTLLLGLIFVAITAITSLIAYRFGIEKIPLDIAVEIISLAVVIIILFVSLVILVPLNRIITEIKTLLTGGQYKQIYTRKIDEIGILAHFFNKITKSLEKASQELKEKRRMSAELNIAQKIQQDILPKEPPNIPYLSIMAKTKPAVEIGGDAFDFIKSKDENIIFYIGDMTGHGVPAGLGMMMVNTLLNTFSDMYDNAYEIITNTNKYLSPLIQSTRFMTMVMFRWHVPTQQMYYVGAGHEHIIHIKNKTKEIYIKKSGGIALGMVPNISHMVKEVKMNFEPNDILILYTDGLTEAKNIHGERFSLERLREIIKKINLENSAETIFHEISNKITNFIDNTVQEDDMTLLVVKRNPA